MVVRNVERIRSAVGHRARRRLRQLRARLSGTCRPAILMYHRIADESFDPWGLAVSPDRFRQQMSWLAGHRSPLPLAEFAHLHRLGDLPEDAVAVTFDDGYACSANIAAPILARFGIPATIFLPAGLIGHTDRFWWDELAEIVMNYPGSSIDVAGRSFDIGDRRRADKEWPGDNRRRTPRQKSFYALWAELQPKPIDEIERTLAELLAQYPAPLEDERTRLMTPGEVRSIASHNIEFGSHSLLHATLPGLPAAEKAREIGDSVTECERLTERRPVTFADPFGDFDAECEALVEDAGFECAVTVQPRAIAIDDDVFALPRLKVCNWTWRQLRQELADAGWRQAQLANRA